MYIKRVLELMYFITFQLCPHLEMSSVFAALAKVQSVIVKQMFAIRSALPRNFLSKAGLDQCTLTQVFSLTLITAQVKAGNNTTPCGSSRQLFFTNSKQTKLETSW